MKKTTARLFSLVLVLSIFVLGTVSIGASGKVVIAGTYDGSAPGYHGHLTITVTLDEEGKILLVMVNEDHDETPGIGTLAIDRIPAAMIETQSLGVDNITGATITVDGIIAGAAQALENAGLDPENYGYAKPEAPAEEQYVLDPAAMPVKVPVSSTINLTDAKGREVTVGLPISTYAISTMDVIDYIIPLLGEEAFHKLVGSGQDGGGGLQTYARLYTPIVGNYMAHTGQISDHNAPFDLEMILAMDPDVLIVNSAMSAHNYALEIERILTAAGIPIVLVDVPGRSFTTSAQSTLKLLGQIFQKEERAAEVISFLDEQFAFLGSKGFAERTDKPTVYYEKSGYSEIFGSTSTSASGWGTVISAAGGDNIADPLLLDSSTGRGGSHTLDPEYIIQSDPDYIILSGSGAGWMDNIPGSKPSAPAFDIINRVGWNALQAVQNNNVYELAHATSRSIFGVFASLKLATVFYPDEFRDLDPAAVIAEFFERFMLVDSDVTGWWYRLNEVK